MASHIFRDVNMPAPRAHPCFDAKSRPALGYGKGSWGQQVTRKNVGSLPSRHVATSALLADLSTSRWICTTISFGSFARVLRCEAKLK